MKDMKNRIKSINKEIEEKTNEIENLKLEKLELEELLNPYIVRISKYGRDVNTKCKTRDNGIVKFNKYKHLAKSGGNLIYSGVLENKKSNNEKDLINYFYSINANGSRNLKIEELINLLKSKVEKYSNKEEVNGLIDFLGYIFQENLIEKVYSNKNGKISLIKDRIVVEMEGN